MLWGSSGNDTLNGGPGADRLVGNTGNDTATWSDSPAGVNIDLATDSLSGGDAEGDTFARRDTEHTDLADIENLEGSPHDDILTGDSKNNTIQGLAGADALSGGNGNDTASYSLSNSAVTVRLHSLIAANGDAEGDTFTNTVTFMWTDSENNHHTATLPDIENLTGSDYDDILAGDARDNIIIGNAGNDRLYGGPGGGNDVIDGGPGKDTIYGGQGDDTLTGGPGNDTLIPGPGTDTLIFTPYHGNDTIKRFDPGEDLIDLSTLNPPDGYSPELIASNNDTLLDLTDIGGGETVFENTILNTDDITFIV